MKIISTFSLVCLICVVNVKSQGFQLPSLDAIQNGISSGQLKIPTIPAQIMSQILPLVQKLQTDFAGMQASGKVDNTLLLTDIQAIVDAATGYTNDAPPKVQAIIAGIQKKIDAMKAAGKADPQVIISIIQDVYSIGNVIATSKTVAKTTKSPATTAATKTG